MQLFTHFFRRAQSEFSLCITIFLKLKEVKQDISEADYQNFKKSEQMWSSKEESQEQNYGGKKDPDINGTQQQLDTWTRQTRREGNWDWIISNVSG